MEKLINKFAGYKKMVDSEWFCAEECKKVAIEFLIWSNRQPREVRPLSELPDNYEEWIREELDKGFNKFIENCYEQTNQSIE